MTPPKIIALFEPLNPSTLFYLFHFFHSIYEFSIYYIIYSFVLSIVYCLLLSRMLAPQRH